MGLRGSGKSTIGRRLAAELGMDFLDLDDATAAALGCPTVRDAWQTLGEPVFRAAESYTLAEALTGPPRIIALGGGTPTAPGASDLLLTAAREAHAIIIYLNAPPDTLRARLAADPATTHATRPSLTGRDPLDEIEEVHARRHPLYHQLATHIIDAQGHIADVIARLHKVIPRT
jgi:shikimate kinase